METQIEVKDSNTLLIHNAAVPQVWTRENLESDIVILTNQIADIQKEIAEKQAWLAELDKAK